MIRPAVEADLPALVAMIHELAAYERLSDQVRIDEDALAAGLFGPDAVAHDTVAEDGDGGLAGHALWFRTFSTFLGTSGIWLEDLYVRPQHRRRGHARALLMHLRGLTGGRVDWEVLDWNTPAIEFYGRLGARPLPDWVHYRWHDGEGSAP